MMVAIDGLPPLRDVIRKYDLTAKKFDCIGLQSRGSHRHNNHTTAA